MSTSTPSPSLSHLPRDVTHHIFHLLSPSDILNYAQISRDALATVSDPYVWRSAAKRHLALSLPSPSFPTSELTPKTLFNLAASLSCHWSVSTGLFVAGVPVHRRSGFVCVSSRGGVEIPLAADRSESAYVFGGRHHDRAVPAAVPALSLQFSLDREGPFPVAGMQCRIVHAAEPDHTGPDCEREHEHEFEYEYGAVNPPLPVDTNLDADADTDVETDADVDKESDTDMDLEGLIEMEKSELFGSSSNIDGDEEAEQYSKTLVKAFVTVKVNDHTVQTVTCSPTAQFQICEFTIPPHALVTKPGVNTLSVQYGGESSAGYWLRNVSIASMISPLPALDDNVLDFPLAHAELNKAKKKKKKTIAVSGSRSGLNTPSASSAASSSSDSIGMQMMGGAGRRVQRRATGLMASGSRVTPLALEQAGIERFGATRSGGEDDDDDDDLTETTNSNIYSSGRAYRLQHAHPHGKRDSKGAKGKGALQSGKQAARPKHLHHKQNFHHRSPRTPQSRVSRAQR